MIYIYQRDQRESRERDQRERIIRMFHANIKEGLILFIPVLAELRDHIIDTVSQYINEKRIEPYVQEEMTKIAVILRKLADEGDPPHFGLHSLGSIEYHLEKEISSTGRKMLQEKFAMEPRETALDTGMSE